MKRYASNYLYLPGLGFLKQYMIEINEEKYVTHISPLSEEFESVSWLPGLIALIPEQEIKNITTSTYPELCSYFSSGKKLEEIPAPYHKELSSMKLVLARLYPFDFISMLPKEDTTILFIL